MTGALRKIRDFLLFCLIFGVLAVIAARLDYDGAATRFNGPLTAIDGDTLSADGQRLRLSGMDAPELAQTCLAADGRQWSCGKLARRRLAGLARQDDLTCEGNRHDRYGRLLVQCQQAGGDIGAVLVREGLAVAYGSYRAEEKVAREAASGIWQGRFERPQDWRKLQAGRDAGGMFTPVFDWLQDKIWHGAEAGGR